MTSLVCIICGGDIPWPHGQDSPCPHCGSTCEPWRTEGDATKSGDMHRDERGARLTWYEVLEVEYPSIEWREPQKVVRASDGVSGYACRICVALVGLNGADVGDLEQDPAEVRRHIDVEHPRSERYRELEGEAIRAALTEAIEDLARRGSF